jgi:predicted alpha/beta superfamily hydrolase
VLYITDGASGISKISAITSHLSGNSKRIPPMIVVGVTNAGSRFKDLNNNESSKQFLNFMTSELQPFINQQYQTNGENLLLGVSLGGQFVVKSLWEQPQAFDGYFSISPYLGDKGYELIERVKTMADNVSFENKSLYLSVANEGFYQGVDEMAFTLSKYPVKGLTWSFVKMEEEAHSSIFMPQAYAGLQDYYRDYAPAHFKNLADFEEKGGLAGLQKVYAKRTASLIPIALLEDIAYFYKDQKRYLEIIELARYNVKIHPTSGRALRNLAESYERVNNFDQALQTYQRALNVAISNKHSTRSIETHTKNLKAFKQRSQQDTNQ